MSDSSTIEICRVLCIFFMTYVHVNPGLDESVGDLPPVLSAMKLVLGDTLGRGSVPALSVISGYLAVGAYERRGDWFSYVRDRWRRLVIPLVAWNAIFIALALLIWLATGVQPTVVRKLGVDQLSFLPLLDRFTGYDYGSAVTALNFLRDIFVCSLLAPLTLKAMRRAGTIALALIWLAGLTTGFAPVVMRPNILMFFAAGVFLASREGRLVPGARTALLVAAALLVSLAPTCLVPRLAESCGKNVPSTILRLVVATAFLTVAAAMSRSRCGRWLSRLEPAMYLLFLSHASIQLILWGAWQIPFGRGLGWPYPVFYLGAPLATLLAALVLHRALVHLPTAVQRVLNGRPLSRRAPDGPAPETELAA